jgi:hypothetical protein
MNSLTSYFKKEQQLKQLEVELNSLKEDEELKKAIEFKKKVEKMAEEYGFSNESVLQVLVPEKFAEEAVAEEPKKTRKPRKLKTYKNPLTGEVVETKGMNHRVLKAWKKEHGDETVESWLVDDNEPKQQPLKEEPKVEKEEQSKEEPKDAPKEEKVDPVEATPAEASKAPAKPAKRELPVKPLGKGSKPKFQFATPAKTTR